MSFSDQDRRKVYRGILVTLLGGLGSVANGGFLFLARRLFGGVSFGLFAIAMSFVELVTKFLVAGFADALAYFGARSLAHEDESGLYCSLAGCMALPVVGASCAALLIASLAPLAYQTMWAGQHSAELVTWLRWLALFLPLSVLVRLPAHAPRIHLDMRWPALVLDTALPLFNMALGLAAWLAGIKGFGLVLAALGSLCLTLPLSWWGYSRYFSWRRTLDSLGGEVPYRRTLRFAIPQSINMIGNYSLTRADTMMLSFWFPADTVGVYTLVSETCKAIRAVRTAAASVFGPLVARYQAAGNKEGIQQALDQICVWVTAASIPVALVVLVVYPDLVVGAGEAWPISRWVPWLLVGESVVNALIGASANVLVMSGHGHVLTKDFFFVILTNLVLNYLCIPRLGLVGAALATVVAGSLVVGLVSVQIWRLEQIRLRIRPYVRPLLAMTVAATLVAHGNKWTTHSAWLAWGPLPYWSAKLGVVSAACLAYVLLSGSLRTLVRAIGEDAKPDAG